MKYVIDTNVPIVANGRSDKAGDPPASFACQMAAVQFLGDFFQHNHIVVDTGGEVRAEYHRYLNPTGQPGVGDLFYLEVLKSHPSKIEIIDLPKRDNGEYLDCPKSLIDSGFDVSDRKFVALAKRSGGTVAHAVDRGWIIHAVDLKQNGIIVNSLCGCDINRWFDA